MSVYLDASVLVPLFIPDRFNMRTETYLEGKNPPVAVSNFAATEFSSALARLVRIGDIAKGTAQSAFADFDAWVVANAQRVEMSGADLGAAEGFLRRLDLTLRTGDAIHLAIAQRLQMTLATFDQKLIACARALRIAAVRP